MYSKVSKAVKKAYDADPENRKRHSERMRAYYAKGNRPQTDPRACQCLESGKTYSSFMAAERDTGAGHAHISGCCKGACFTAAGYHWQYAEGQLCGERVVTA